MKFSVVQLALVISVITSNVFGQPQNRNFDPSNMPKESKITGKVLDSSTSGPVEYATIAIYSMRDSMVVSGGITDATGNFVIDNLPYGRFYIDISFIGFTKSRINGVMLNPTKKAVSLGEIKLEPATTALSEVEIVGNKSTVEYKIDKKIVSIGANVMASGGTAVEALENVPSVQVDIEGNVALRGSSNFTVLIDGRPSVLKGSEALQQIPASVIQNIEIITNPSAKYDPEGNSGIINIIMKKQKQSGMNGVVNASVSTNGGMSTDFLFNMRTSKANYYLSANYNKMRFENEMQSDKITYINKGTDSAYNLLENILGSGVFAREGYGFKGGIDFFIDNKNTLSVSGGYRANQFDRDFARKNYSATDSVGKGITNYTNILQDNNMARTRDFWEVNLDYTHKFNDNGHQLQAMFGFSEGPSESDAFLNEYLSNPLWEKLSGDLTNQKTVEGGNEKEYDAKLDYTYPISENSRFEAGYEGNYESSEDDYNLFYNLTEVASKMRDMTFIEQSHGIYTTYAGTFKTIDFLAGFRTEYSGREFDQKSISSDTSISFSKWDFFPTLHLTKKLKNDVQVQASYSRRIRRPGGRELDPVETIVDSKNIRKGNPGLSPEYTDSYELNVQKSFNGSGFISGELFHRATSKKIEDYEYKFQDTITVQSYANLSNAYATGFEGMINMPLTKWWTFNTSVNLFNSRMKGQLSETETTDNSEFTWNARTSSIFKLKWGTQLQIMGNYEAPANTAQGRREGFFFSNIGVRQDFFKRKLTLSVNIRDVFGDNKFERTTTGSNFTSFYSMKRQPRVITFSVSFKINNYKPERKGNGNGGMNEMEFDNSGGGGMM